MFKAEEINFKKIEDWEFEFICYELISSSGFSDVTWRKKGADSGRDIEAKLKVRNQIIGEFEEKWFFECKHYTKGVPPNELNSKIAWADAEKPHHLVIMVSSHLTNGSRDWIDKIRKDKRYDIHIVEGEDIKKLIQKYPTLMLMYFASGGISNLLFSTKKNWLTYGFYPSYDQYRLLIVRNEVKKLSKNDLAFLFATYFVNYNRYNAVIEIEGRSKEKLHIELIPHLKRKGTYGQPLYNPSNGPNLSKVVGFVEDMENIPYNFFIAGEAFFFKPIKLPSFNEEEEHKLPETVDEPYKSTDSIYVFYRCGKNEFIEVIVSKNNSFDSEIRIINDLDNWSLMFQMQTLGYREEFTDKIFHMKLMETIEEEEE